MFDFKHILSMSSLFRQRFNNEEPGGGGGAVKPFCQKCKRRVNLDTYFFAFGVLIFYILSFVKVIIMHAKA